jgi:ribulose bisphosphate carboxylase small subunit
MIDISKSTKVTWQKERQAYVSLEQKETREVIQAVKLDLQKHENVVKSEVYIRLFILDQFRNCTIKLM